MNYNECFLSTLPGGRGADAAAAAVGRELGRAGAARPRVAMRERARLHHGGQVCAVPGALVPGGGARGEGGEGQANIARQDQRRVICAFFSFGQVGLDFNSFAAKVI